MSGVDHKTKRRAPAVIGRWAFVCVFAAVLSLFTDGWSHNDTHAAFGGSILAVMTYFYPPEVEVSEVYTKKQTFKERLLRWF